LSVGKKNSIWVLSLRVIALIFIGFIPTVHKFPDYIRIKCSCLALEPFIRPFFQSLVVTVRAVSSTPLLLPNPLADLHDLNKCFSRWPLRALLVNIPLHSFDSFHPFVNFACEWPNTNEEIALRKLLTGNRITELRK
jgi:hypothetical protein